MNTNFTSLQSIAMQAMKRSSTALQTAIAELELLTSSEDWQAYFEDRHATSISGVWVSFKINDILVRLHIATMTVMVDAGGGAATTARYLLPMTQRRNASEAAEMLAAKTTK